MVHTAVLAARSTALQHVVVCSRNPVKIRAVQGAFSLVFPESSFSFKGASVSSDVPPQPFGDKETLAGARNRARNAAEQHSGATVVALEGGVGYDDAGALECFAWIVVRSSTTGAEGRARTASFLLPERVADLVRNGMELGEADDKVFGRTGSGQGSGTVGRLTRGLVTREAFYEHATVLALAPFANPEHFPEHRW
mmetsp:Transcript_30510/g.72653  ORF Transcript_30510/g.72653 Transcript_30510/m.72653 type:complete len:196 (-) Transcript_30510:344-931(-)